MYKNGTKSINNNTNSNIDIDVYKTSINSSSNSSTASTSINTTAPISSSPECKKSIYRKNDPNTRYDENGTRYQSVAIPFRYTNNQKQPVELLMITSRRLGDLVFCGGGWEKTETGSEAALREAKEEAGIVGEIICELYSDHNYISNKQQLSRVWFFLMQVTHELDVWDENTRERRWISVDDADAALSAKRRCKFNHAWIACMKWFIAHDLYSATNITGSQIKKYDEQQATMKPRITFTSDDIYYNANASNFNRTIFSSSTAVTDSVSVAISIINDNKNSNVSNVCSNENIKTSGNVSNSSTENSNITTAVITASIS